MNESATLDAFLADAFVASDVHRLRPDYRAMLVAVDGIIPSGSDGASDALLQTAEADARKMLDGGAVEQIRAWRSGGRRTGRLVPSHNGPATAWRRSCGAHPPGFRGSTGSPTSTTPCRCCTRSRSAERTCTGTPVRHDWSAPRAGRPFDTVAGGADVVERPEPSEVVWCDNAAVTCRRWNWRQGRRTQLSDDTTAALFILDALEPFSDEALQRATDDLVAHVGRLGPNVQVARRLFAADATAPEGA